MKPPLEYAKTALGGSLGPCVVGVYAGTPQMLWCRVAATPLAALRVNAPAMRPPPAISVKSFADFFICIAPPPNPRVTPAIHPLRIAPTSGVPQELEASSR